MNQLNTLKINGIGVWLKNLADGCLNYSPENFYLNLDESRLQSIEAAISTIQAVVHEIRVEINKEKGNNK